MKLNPQIQMKENGYTKENLKKIDKKKGLNHIINGMYNPLTIEEIGQVDSKYLEFLDKRGYIEFNDEVKEKLYKPSMNKKEFIIDKEEKWSYL